jgi:hypothetical protein
MQDGDAIPAGEAGEWLRENITDPDAQISITWTVPEAPNPAALARVLDILFAPRPNDEAA